MRSCLGFLVLMMVAGSALAQAEQSDKPGDIPKGREREIDFQASNDTLQLKFISSGKQVGVDNSRFSAGFFLSEQRDFVMSAGLVFPVDYNFGRLSVLIGPQVYAALLHEENNDVVAMSLGAELRFVLDKDIDLAVAGYGYYAPDILTLGSADKLSDFSAQLELPLSKKMKGFAGYRWFKFDLTQGGGTQTLQNQLFLGLGYRF